MRKISVRCLKKSELRICQLLICRRLRAGALSAAERSYPTSEVGAVVESARLRRCRNSREELPCVRGQGWRLRGTTLRPRSVAARMRHPASEVRAAARRSYPVSKVSDRWEETTRVRGQGGGQEELP